MKLSSSQSALLIGLSAVLATYGANEPRVSIEPRMARAAISANIRVDSSLVLIPVTVTDRMNRPVTELDRTSFRVFEGKTERQVVDFLRDDSPVSVGIVFDTSGSMRDKTLQARAAVARFLGTANPEDEFFLVEFNNAAQVTIPFTRHADDVETRLGPLHPEGKTALLDAVHLALSYMKGAANPRRALLVISDGVDNDSRFSEAEMRNLVRETDTWIYSIAICRQSVMIPEEEPFGTRLLTTLAEATGGREFAVRDPNELPRVAEKIGLELRNQYILGFKPSGVDQDGRYHKVKVQLIHTRPLNVSARPGYYAPESQK